MTDNPQGNKGRASSDEVTGDENEFNDAKNLVMPGENEEQQPASLRLRQLRNKCLRKWEAGDPGEVIASEANNGNNIARIRDEAKTDILEVWNAAAELENELMLLHEELDARRVMQEEFEDEKARQHAEVRELQEKLQQIEVFWKERVRSAEHELGAAERRLKQISYNDVQTVHSSPNTTRVRELEERYAEMISELEKGREELARSNAERTKIKHEVVQLQTQLKKHCGSVDELSALAKKYEAMKLRSAGLATKLTQAENTIEGLSESVLEGEAKIMELEAMVREIRQREKELTLHLEALRDGGETDDKITGGTTHDLFAELQQAHAAVTVSSAPNTTSFIPVQGLSFDTNKYDTDQGQIPTRPDVTVNSLEKTNEISTENAADSIGGASRNQSRIHIHLHQHHHSHQHSHWHQHDHLHQCAGHLSKLAKEKETDGRDPSQNGVLLPSMIRSEVREVYDLVRAGKAVIGEVVQRKTHPAPEGSPASIYNTVGETNAYTSNARLEPVISQKDGTLSVKIRELSSNVDAPDSFKTISRIKCEENNLGAEQQCGSFVSIQTEEQKQRGPQQCCVPISEKNRPPAKANREGIQLDTSYAFTSTRMRGKLSRHSHTNDATQWTTQLFEQGSNSLKQTTS